MSLSLRLTIWFAGFATLVVAALATVAYVHEARAPYSDLDRALVEEGALVAPLLQLEAGDRAPVPSALPSAGDVRTFVYLYQPDGALTLSEPRDAPVPPIDALAVLARDDPPAFEPWLRWIPGARATPAGGAFATAPLPDGGRARLHARRLDAPGDAPTISLAWTSLETVDRSVRRFRVLLLAMSLGSIGVVWGGGYFLARGALRPVRTLIGTARQIADSSEFARRVPESDRADELGVLASTVNHMLDALEGAYRAQQRFVADAAHELRTPLTAIRGNTDLLAHSPHLTAEDRAVAVAQVDEAAKRATQLVQELLILARSDAGLHLTLRPVELTAVVLDAVAQARTAHQRVIALGELVPATVLGHEARLHQLTTILLDNAIKYTPAPGSIVVSVSASEGSATITVADQGVGIAEADLPHVFERFYRADRSRSPDPGGVGLGLAIARWIASEHAAQISVTSTLGAGSTFVVTLPLTNTAYRDDTEDGAADAIAP